MGFGMIPSLCVQVVKAVLRAHLSRDVTSNSVILTGVDADEPLQPPFRLRNSK